MLSSDVKKLILLEIIIMLLTAIISILLKCSLSLIMLIELPIILGNIIYFIFLIKQHKKIKDLSKYMNRILNEDYSFDIKDYEEGCISSLKNDIYKMTVKLKEQSDISLKDKKYLEEVLSDISHQLKTPLTSMYVINDVLLSDSNIEEAKKQEFLLRNRSQLERIEWLVTTLLKISRLDSGSEKIKRKPVALEELISKSIEPIKIPMELKEQKLELDYDPNIMLDIDLNWTREALINILKNAHEHTPFQGKIIIRANNTPIYVELEIIDNGVGISEEDLPHIFERFYKGKGNKESIGIGLSMAKKIINLENGEIKANSSSVGTTFNIKFYKGNL